MTEEEAILWLTIGFMIVVGIWLISLTYLVLKRIKAQEKPKEEEPGEDKKEETED